MNNKAHGDARRTALAALGLGVGALAIPGCGFLQYQSHNEQAACASNEKQLSLGLLQYVQDNDEKYPTGRGRTGVGWAGPIYPYVKSTNIFHCPLDETQGAGVAESYGYNRNLGHDRSLAELNSPADTVTLFEISGDAADVTQTDEGASNKATSFSAAGNGLDRSLWAGRGAGPKYATGAMAGRATAATNSQFAGIEGRHDGGSNFALADGHVKYLQPQAVSSGGDAADTKATQTTTAAAGTTAAPGQSFAATFSLH